MSYSSCYTTASINLGCAANVGGIAKAYVVSGELTGATFNSAQQITGTSATSGAQLYTFEVQKQTSSLTETFNNSLENGTLFYQQDLALVFHKMSQDKRNQLKLISQSRGLQVFAEDNNGTIWFLGGISGEALSGGYLSAGTGSSGTAFGDSNQYGITLSFFSKDPMTTLGSPLASVFGGTINP
jgi:hypothetical protein